MASSTLLVLLQQLAHRLYDAEQRVVTGTASGGNTTTLIDDGTTALPGLVYSDGDDNAYDRRYIYNETNGEASNITVGGYAGSSGTLTISPATTANASGHPYIITGDHPQVLKNVINEALRNMYVPSFFPLSLHIATSDDNDMETAPATSFNANKTDATLTNESTIVKHGAQSLKVTASATAGYTHFGNFGVNEGEPLYVAIDCYVTITDNAFFTVYDASNGLGIATATSDEEKWMELVVPFTVPSGCELIQSWAASTLNGDITYWDNYHLWRSGEGVYPGPSWLTKPSQMIDIRAFPQGAGGPGSLDYRVNERRSVPLHWEIENEDIRGNNPLELEVWCTGSRPYIYAYRPLAELSTDSATTTADKDRVVAVAEKLIREPDKASEYLGTLRAAVLTAPRAKSQVRYGVRIR